MDYYINLLFLLLVFSFFLLLVTHSICARAHNIICARTYTQKYTQIKHSFIFLSDQKALSFPNEIIL